MDERAPRYITAVGGKYYTDDRSDATIPDTMFCIFEFESGKAMEFNVFEGGRSNPIKQGELELASGDATIFANQRGWEILPSKKKEFNNPVKSFEPRKYVFKEALLDDGSAESATKNVINDFLERCIDRNPQVLCTLEDGHRSTCFAHLANIAYKLGRRLEWDADREVFTNCDEANSLLHYKYRNGYKLG
jgi:hypothetical protein